MLNSELRQAAERFVTSVRGATEFDAYLKAHIECQSDPVLRGIRKRFNERSAELQTKQSRGTLTQEEIDELRELQRNLNEHPVTTRYIHARQALVTSLQEHNRAVGQELGFDFASAAAAKSCCG